MRMSDGEAEASFRQVRWTRYRWRAGMPALRRSGRLRAPPPEGWPSLSLQSLREGFFNHCGTLFASHKLPLRGYLAGMSVFCNEVKGKSALALSRDLGLSYKSAFVLLHKLREAMAEELRGRVSRR
jgi:hypothetical protein